MESIFQFQKIKRTLIYATWILLAFNGVCKILRYDVDGKVASVSLIMLSILYGAYLYHLQKKNLPTNMVRLVGESILILLIDWIACFQLAAFLFPMLIIRRAMYSKIPDIWYETACISAAFILTHWIHGGYADTVSLLHQRVSEAFILVLTAIITQPMVQMTKALQTDKERLQLKLHRAENSYKHAAELAMRDELTGLYNYRAFHEDIQAIGNEKFALLLIDVDYFKDFNDVYGHAAGDWALRQIGQAILESVRSGDKVYRYGGEEFAVVLGGIEEDVVLYTAERVRLRIAEKSILYEGKQLNGVTVSVGVSVVENCSGSVREIFEQTDQALYQAKAKGRNKVVLVGATGLE